MSIVIEPCQYCGSQQVEASWTLCQDCRRTYAKVLHQLSHNMHLLQRVTRHEYKLGEPGSGGKPQGGEAPAPVNMRAIDLLDEAEPLLQDAGTTREPCGATDGNASSAACKPASHGYARHATPADSSASSST